MNLELWRNLVWRSIYGGFKVSNTFWGGILEAAGTSAAQNTACRSNDASTCMPSHTYAQISKHASRKRLNQKSGGKANALPRPPVLCSHRKTKEKANDQPAGSSIGGSRLSRVNILSAVNSARGVIAFCNVPNTSSLMSPLSLSSIRRDNFSHAI